VEVGTEDDVRRNLFAKPMAADNYVHHKETDLADVLCPLFAVQPINAFSLERPSNSPSPAESFVQHDRSQPQLPLLCLRLGKLDNLDWNAALAVAKQTTHASNIVVLGGIARIGVMLVLG
jgi:hypothetical protein